MHLPGCLLRSKFSAEMQRCAEIDIAFLVLEQAWPQLSLKFLHCSLLHDVKVPLFYYNKGNVMCTLYISK